MINLTPQAPCCGESLSAATDPVSGKTPEPGHYSVCVYCFAWLQFRDDMSLRLISEGERTWMPADLREALGRAELFAKDIRQQYRTTKKHRIAELFCFACIDTDGDEGVPAIEGPNGMVLPLMGSDRARMDSLRHAAQSVADQSGKPVRLLRFRQMEEVAVIEPRKEGRPS